MMLVALPLATAQSTISGTVKDSSGAVMVGVKVDAASEVLIEKSRTSTTNEDGRYAIVAVRPGSYTITFTADGFTAVKQQVEVPANVTVPVDAEMTLGAFKQTVEVTVTQIATVDVENVAHPEVLTRKDIDALPTARNLQSIGSYIPGVHLNLPDVGGSQQTQQVYMAAHGNPAQNNITLLDGLLVSSTGLDGQVQPPMILNAQIGQATYQTSSNTTDVSGGGVFINLVPKDGGNSLHGDFFGAYVGSQFVGSSIDQSLLSRGLSAQSKITKIQDFDGSLGGPLRKDKLWFLLSGRKQLTYQQSPLSKQADGSPEVDRSFLYTGHLRLTYQMNSKNKFSAMLLRTWKTAQNEVVTNVANAVSGVAANFNASTRRTPVMFYVAQGSWTGTITPRLILQAGFSITKQNFNILYQAGQYKTPFTPEWYSNVLLNDTVKGLHYNVGNQQNYYKWDRYVGQAGGVYVTGSHQIKFGIQDSWGPVYQNTVANGDLYATEANGVPTQVTVFNTPTYSKPYLKADLGIYVMDTWKFKRLSVTPGIRWEYLSNEVKAQSAPAGRFVPARNFAAITCDTVKGISCFHNWAPRIGIVYDLFGDHKTAIKASAGKYNAPLTSSNLSIFNPMALASQTRTWNGGGCTGQSCFPLDSQIGASPSSQFGLQTDRKMDPNYHREYNLQYTVGIQRELRRGLTLNFTWLRRADYQQSLTLNNAVPSSAWSPVTIYNPLDGTPITVFNLDKSYLGRVPAVYQTNAPRSLRANAYSGFETSVQGRLPHGASVFAGWTIDRELMRNCDQSVNTSTFLNDPNSLRFCDLYGSMHQDLGQTVPIPRRHEFKIQGNLPLPYKFEFSASLYSSPVYNTGFQLNNFPIPASGSVFVSEPVFAGQQQGFKEVYWTVNASTRYPMDCNCPTPGGVVNPGAHGPETIMLVAPGSRLTPQLNQFDIAIRRSFEFGDRYRIQTEAQIFNVNNANTVTAQSQTLGTSIAPYAKDGPGGVPTAILNPRMLRLAVQFHF
ncbi:MAG: carboxypeptidase regulatory-like domain-containing protein [Acidobacteriota bacterium]